MSVAGEALIHFFYPKHCAFCGRVVRPDRSLCPNCVRETEKFTRACPRCGLPKQSCVCTGKTVFYDKILCVYPYRDTVREGIVHYKKGGDARAADFFALAMARRCKEQLDFVPDGVLYVPQTKKERAKREFDQCRELASGVAAHLHVPLLDCMVKIYDAPPQKTRRAHQRGGNVAGVFDVNDPSRIAGGRFILVDDVKTTGATINECAKMLKLYDAEYVLALTLAAVEKQI